MANLWLLAKKDSIGSDTGPGLRSLGFILVGDKHDLFYEAVPPSLWRIQHSPQDTWTGVYDPDNKLVFSQLVEAKPEELIATLAFER